MLGVVGVRILTRWWQLEVVLWMWRGESPVTCHNSSVLYIRSSRLKILCPLPNTRITRHVAAVTGLRVVDNSVNH